MARRFQELDWRRTPMGDLTLRRRREPVLDVDVHEVLLGDEFLMSSLFTAAEVELGRLALAELPGDDLDVVVGGLGLGYTTRAVLDDERVRSLYVVEAQDAVIDWHERGLLPLAGSITSDPRCRLVHGDFFADVRQGLGSGLGDGAPHRWHAVVVDIDHTPTHLLSPSHADFYTAMGLSRLVRALHPGGVFALWSDAAPDPDVLALLGRVLDDARAHVVTFPNHYTGGSSSNTVYVARAPVPT